MPRDLQKEFDELDPLVEIGLAHDLRHDPESLPVDEIAEAQEVLRPELGLRVTQS